MTISNEQLAAKLRERRRTFEENRTGQLEQAAEHRQRAEICVSAADEYGAHLDEITFALEQLDVPASESPQSPKPKAKRSSIQAMVLGAIREKGEAGATMQDIFQSIPRKASQIKESVSGLYTGGKVYISDGRYFLAGERNGDGELAIDNRSAAE